MKRARSFGNSAIGSAVAIAIGLAFAGCASPSTKKTSTASGATHGAVASSGTVKGHWVQDSTPQTGSHLPRRYFVPDGESEAEAARAAGSTSSPVESSKPGMRESTRTLANGLHQG